MQDAAANVARIDPAQCRLPPGRLEIAPHHCAALIDSIREFGQLVPGIVRRTQPGDPCRYEIVSGARRHFAVTTLRQTEPAFTQPFFAAIRPLTNEQAFAAGDRDNRARADISHYQRALDYTRALELYYDGNQTRMAAEIRMTPPNLSRYLTLAALPSDILAAFGDPACITITHLRLLTPYLKDGPSEHLLRTAQDLAADQQARARYGTPFMPPEPTLRRLMATGELLRTGAIQITITATHPDDRVTALAATAEILDTLYDSEKGWPMTTLSGSESSATFQDVSA